MNIHFAILLWLSDSLVPGSSVVTVLAETARNLPISIPAFFVSTATGVPLPKLAARIIAGKTLNLLGCAEEVISTQYCIKESIFPFSKFPSVYIILGSELKFPGEVMGIAPDFGLPFAKSQMTGGGTLPMEGNVFICVNEGNKQKVAHIANLDFIFYATPGTGQFISVAGILVNIVPKLTSGQRPDVIGLIKNTPSGKNTQAGEVQIRTATMQNRVPIMTTLRGAEASLKEIKLLQGSEVQVRVPQEFHQ